MMTMRRRWPLTLPSKSLFQWADNSHLFLLDDLKVEQCWLEYCLLRAITVLTHSPRAQAYLHTHLPWSTEQKGYRIRQWKVWVICWCLLYAAPLLGSQGKSGLGAMDGLWQFFSLGNIYSSGDWRIQGTFPHPMCFEGLQKGTKQTWTLFVTFIPSHKLNGKLNSFLNFRRNVKWNGTGEWSLSFWGNYPSVSLFAAIISLDICWLAFY